MPQSYTCLHYHIVFSTKQRAPMIGDPWSQRLRDMIGGIVRAQRGILHAAGGMPDHLHLLCSLNQTIALADFVRDIKANSSRWVHQTIIGASAFAWQTGYSAFTVSHSAMDAVKTYIALQAEHHRTMTYQDELTEFLRRHEIEYDERYIWE